MTNEADTDPAALGAAAEDVEATCQRCGGPNAPTWHAPSPLWNAVMRNPATGQDDFGIVCPPCFAELAAARGYRYVWHFGPHEDVSGLWHDRDGRVWDASRCLWVAAASRQPAPQEPQEPTPVLDAAAAGSVSVDGAWDGLFEDLFEVLVHSQGRDEAVAMARRHRSLIEAALHAAIRAEAETPRTGSREKWWREGSMVAWAEGSGDDDSGFVADAASDDDAERFVDFHNAATALAVAHDCQPEPQAHEPHHGNHIGYVCGFSGPHCWGCNEPWPCRVSRENVP